MIKTIKYFSTIVLLLSFFSVLAQTKKYSKPTICLLGGTPSSSKIIDEIPDDLKAKYNFISFNRPGFGNTPNEVWDENRLFELASEAGLKKNDFGVIGVSGGGPLAILIARKFNLKHCGVISGMVPAHEYFAYADSTFTKSIMSSAVTGYNEFKKTVESFPNVEEVVKQAHSPVPVAVRACYDELHFILTDISYDRKTFKKMNVSWLHGENDKNVALESAQLFLSKFKKADLTIIPEASHSIDARVLVRQLLDKWKQTDPLP
ncbi:alpha/beta hydrolase [Flavobacterium sp.]|uniref:alpha/beta fold hydrolase n=1 Tax=Flavobacterium sp. TaxID=239 RepID=UPI003262CE55